MNGILMMGSPMNKPKYQHDCDECVFLGTFQNEQDTDLYWCGEKKGILPTVIARFSDEGSDYASGMCFGRIHANEPSSSIGEAYRRAIARGLDVGEYDDA